MKRGCLKRSCPFGAFCGEHSRRTVPRLSASRTSRRSDPERPSSRTAASSPVFLSATCDSFGSLGATVFPSPFHQQCFLYCLSPSCSHMDDFFSQLYTVHVITGLSLPP
ncbi:hypothetical protein F2Q70_00017905 [Brassica cretica]|uniref:Uncharacterized protein n=1 Tax=Brassica cretica TaxID=69181 RepID=A0A8S9HT99_BRACR|nr:hypothetical protein F2Q70_00017905 [Brassica cretica]